MKRYWLFIAVLGMIFWVVGCVSVDEGTVKENVPCEAFLSAYSTTHGIAEEVMEAARFEELLPKDKVTVSALEYLETTLPWETAGENFPEDIKVVAHCSGDIGNDGVNNIAVVLENKYYGYGNEIYVMCVFEETESGTYRYTEYTDSLFLDREDDAYRTDYYNAVRIENGKLYVTDAKQFGEYRCYESIWVQDEAVLVLDEVAESRMDLASGNGLEIRYKMQEGTAVCEAFSTWNQVVDGIVVYEATFTPERILAGTVDNNYIPTISEGDCTYTPEGEMYDYHRLGISDEMLAEFSAEDAWKVAYIKMMDEILKADEAAGEYKFDLIYLDEDDIPELAYGHTGYWVSVYTYAPGKESLGIENVADIMNRWPYGAFGNVGYEYIPGENVIRNYDNDQAGAIRYTSYYKVGNTKEIEDIYYLKSIVYDEEGNINAKGEGTAVYEYFYNGERQITEEEYNHYCITGDFRYIEGTQEGYKIVAELCKENSKVRPVWKDAYRDLIDRVTEAYEDDNSDSSGLTYDLIYLDADFVPELVIGKTDSDAWVSVYTYAYGRSTEGVEHVATLVDAWKYNYGGNYGYRYSPQEGVIEEYVELHGNGYYYKHYNVTEQSELHEGFTFLCEIEWLSEAEGYKETYYRDNEEFTKERWDYFMKSREELDWEFLEGTQSYDEIMVALEQ